MSAFRECHTPNGLMVIVPKTVTSVGNYAFYNSELYYVELGKGVTSIGVNAFQGTENTLDILFCRSETPPSVTSSTFPEKVYTFATLWVPRDDIPAYRSASYWSNFLKKTDLALTTLYMKTTLIELPLTMKSN